MIKAGTISQNNEGKITWSDGSTILAAINQKLAFRSRVSVEQSISTKLIHGFPYVTDLEDEEMERREDLVFATQVFPAAHTTKDD